MMEKTPEVRLSLPLQLNLLPLATQCVEQSALSFGMESSTALSMSLAVEEVYSFLAPQATAGQQMQLSCRNGGYYVEVVFHFEHQVLPVAAFNITATVEAENEKSVAELGLLIAARMVDQLHISTDTGGMSIHFVKEKKYPSQTDPIQACSAQGEFHRCKLEPEEIKQFARRVNTSYGTQAPDWFSCPGKVVDMIRSGEYQAALLADAKGNIGAGTFWRQNGKLAEGFGPYQFVEERNLAERSIDACLSELARTGTICLVFEQPTADMPEEYFERLAPGNPVLYRQLTEDNGLVAYVHPIFREFLQENVQRLFLPRQLHGVEYLGEAQSEFSAFATQLNRKDRQATLSVLWVGKDATKVLQDHVKVLAQEGYAQLEFRLDTGDPAQAILAPHLVAAGFAPQWVLPWGGKGDVIILAHQGGDAR